jgi:protein tyrosine/serine phosphatase
MPAPAQTAFPPCKAVPSPIPGVENYELVDPGIHRGAQPTLEGFQNLWRMGIRFIIDLRGLTEENDSPILGSIASVGPWRYAQSPMDAANINPDQIASILKVLTTPTFRPVFFHCLCGSDRTGCVAASYRMYQDKYTVNDALAEQRKYYGNPMFQAVTNFILNFNRADMAQRVAKAPYLSFATLM